MINLFKKFDKGIHLRIFLKGLEASIIIIFSLLTYDLFKDFIKNEVLKITNIQNNYMTIIMHLLHIFTIFIAEILLVYLLIILFQTEF